MCGFPARPPPSCPTAWSCVTSTAQQHLSNPAWESVMRHHGRPASIASTDAFCRVHPYAPLLVSPAMIQTTNPTLSTTYAVTQPSIHPSNAGTCLPRTAQRAGETDGKDATAVRAVDNHRPAWEPTLPRAGSSVRRRGYSVGRESFLCVCCGTQDNNRPLQGAGGRHWLPSI